MTGMKEGAGEDPFAEDSETTGENASEGRSEIAESTTSANDTDERANADQSTQQQVRIPYKFRRDGVQDGRNRVPLFLQDETKSAERDALRELEERFDGNVSLTDLREALVMAGLNHLDEVEEQLEAWGYGMTFEN